MFNYFNTTCIIHQAHAYMWALVIKLVWQMGFCQIESKWWSIVLSSSEIATYDLRMIDESNRAQLVINPIIWNANEVN